MSLFATHNMIDAVIEDGGDAGWYLYFTLPNNETRDYLQETKEIAIRQAHEDFDIPPEAWHESPALNRQWIARHLCEAKEELDKIIKEVQNPTYAQGDYVVAMSHLYHHLNTAWNGRFEPNDIQKECKQENFDRWRKFPKEDELLLE